MSKPAERTVRAVPRFVKSKRRLPPPIQEETDSQVKALIGDPFAGEAKSGALKGVRVVKFKVGNQQFLLAYSFFPKTNVIEVLDVGVHENFYRDLQTYLDDR